MNKNKLRSIARGKSLSNKLYNRLGYSLVELLLAMALFSMFAAGIIFLVLGSFGSNQRSARLTQAKLYLESTNEALRSISLEAFNLLSAGATYGLQYDDSANKWELLSTPDDPDGAGPFVSRTIVIEDVSRDTAGNIGAGTNDPYTRKATTTLVWETGNGLTSSLSTEIYLTDWQGTDWEQTDWSGGAGQSEWSDAAKFESDDGNIDYASSSGQLTLAALTLDNTQSWDFTSDSDYILSDSNKIEVTGGVAQLKEESLLIETQNQSFSQGSGTDPDFWGNPGPYGAWVNTGGGFDDNYYVNLTLPRQRSGNRNDYWRQSITTSAPDPDSVTLNFKWKCTQFSGSPASVTIFANIDTGSGSPNISQAVWSQTITSISTGWQTASVSGLTAKMPTARNYYVKIALAVDYDAGGNDGPFVVAIDNVDLEWQKNSYPADSPYVENDIAWDPEYLGMITDFSETAYKDTNTNVYYQISNDDGSTWYYYNTTTHQWQSTSLPINTNEAADVNQYIKYFPVDNDSLIKFRAYLTSDGFDHQVQLDDITFDYNPDTITLETGTIAVTENWQNFSLKNTYDNNGPIIVASAWENNTDSPASVRLRNVTATSFEAKLDFPPDNYAPSNTTDTATADYIAVEDGDWILNNATKTKIEAERYSTSTIGPSNGWSADSKAYNFRYDNPPLVLHQVMSNNDSNWIASWVSEEGDNTAPPDTNGFQIGLQSAEVSASATHAAETIGYIIIDNVDTDAYGGNNFNTRITTQVIRGHDDGCFTFGSYFTEPQFIFSQQTQTDSDGGFLVRCGSVANNIELHVEEDQDQDEERSHQREIGSFIVWDSSVMVDGKAGIDRYVTSGQLTSSAFQATRNYNLLSWQGDDACTGCDILVQVRTASSLGDLATASWYDYYDPGLLNYLDHQGKTWAQYRLTLTGGGVNTPTVQSIKLNYY